METVIFKAPDITCAHCVKTIRKALGSLPGVSSVEVEIPGREVRIAFDGGRMDRSTLENAMAEAGYPVEGVDASMPHEGCGNSCCGNLGNATGEA